MAWNRLLIEERADRKSIKPSRMFAPFCFPFIIVIVCELVPLLKYLFRNSNQGMYLVGVLVRPNIAANENDLQSRGTTLGNTFNGTATKALLLAYYLPHSLVDFATLATGGRQ